MADDTLHQAIEDFCSSVFSNNTMACRFCGTAVESKTSTFLFKDHSLEVTIPICLKCHRRPHALSLDS